MNINTELLVSITDDFLKPFGCSSDFNSDFCYDPEEEIVYFSILVSDKGSYLFKKYIEETFSFEVENVFMISLLHEVGHHYTLNYFSKPFLKKTTHQKKKISKTLNHLNPNSDKYNIVYSKYFDLKTERVATAWAIKYYKQHKTRCDNFYSKFINALLQEYERIGLTT